jgi:SAM-dependent methyltransferase
VAVGHPLLELVALRDAGPAPTGDQTPAEFVEFGSRQRLGVGVIKREIGRRLYPLKNRVERALVEARLRAAGARAIGPRPDVVTWGKRGSAIEIVLAQIGRRAGRARRIACFGCGTGEELLQIARVLRPASIVGYDYFDHSRAWRAVTSELARRGVTARFHQADLRRSLSLDEEPADLLFSNCVLEHLGKMEESFFELGRLIRSRGWFAAIWGPLWFSYGGDHIAPELGFDAGYEHVRLSPADYLAFYRAHPRNAGAVRDGRPTWLELGLHNFARYDQYLDSISRHFGAPRWLMWTLSTEGWRWRQARLREWDALLANAPGLQPLDLLLESCAILAQRV